MEADFARYYRLEWADHYRGRLSLRRALVLIRGLPPESAVKQAWLVEAEEQERRRRDADLDDALTRYRR